MMTGEVITDLDQLTVEWLTSVLSNNSALTRGTVAAFEVDTSRGNWSPECAATGEEAVQHTAVLQPDVVLMDVNMPGLNGIEATRRIVFGSPHIAVLVLSMFEDDDSVFAALQAGARGYLLKGAPKAEVVRAIRAVVSGEAIFGPAIARRLMGYFARPRPPTNTFPDLTDRERDILNLLARHRSNAEIAQKLVLSEKTIRNYVSNICAKLQAVDRAEAILRAREAGLGNRA